MDGFMPAKGKDGSSSDSTEGRKAYSQPVLTDLGRMGELTRFTVSVIVG